MPTALNLFKFEHPHKARLEDLQMIREDLSRAIQCVRLLLGPPPMHNHAPVFASALQTQALVSYVRCFSTGRRTALKRNVFTPRPELEKVHDEFKKLRDQHVAHPAGPHEHNELIVAAKSADSRAHSIGSYNFFFAGFPVKDLRRFLALLKFVDKQALAEENLLGNELARDLLGSRSSYARARRAFSLVVSREQLYPTKRIRGG